MRLDILLVEKNLFPSREKAKLAIAEDKVLVNGKLANKGSADISEDAVIEVSEHQILKYVSLGGLKLEKAIQEFNVLFKEKTVLDIGASTGGFTDCALQFGAKKVTGVDVGNEQLHESLRNHPKVQSFENQNIKDFTLEEKVDIVVMDVSFTSQVLIFPYLKNFLVEKGVFISLIKPQFELDKRLRFTNGVVTDKKLHIKVIQNLISEAAQQGLFIQKVCAAPSQVKKNTEYLALFYNYPPAMLLDVSEIVKKAS